MKRLLLCIAYCWCSLLLMATTNRNAISAFKLQDIANRQNTNIVYTSTSEFPLDDMSAIYGLSISGYSQLNSDTSLVRVLLIDNHGKSYLVYEDFYLTASNMAFQDMAFETAYLDSVTPDRLKIIIRDARLHLNDVSYNYGDEIATRNSGLDRKTLVRMQQQSQEEYMIDRWNEYNEANNNYWFAGKTALSGLSYEAKKSALGATSDAYQSDGLEYYVGGFFVMRDMSFPNSSEMTSRSSYTNYAESFDWRNRHGRNWMTPVKNQIEPLAHDSIGNGGCWAFAACATAESKMNLQFNQLLDYDLSEQELGSCTDGKLYIEKRIQISDSVTKITPGGGTYEYAFEHMTSHGIVTEDCMPFQNNENVPCNDKCENPTDVITIDDYRLIMNNADTLKHYLINNGPFYSVVSNIWMNHAMCLCGYGTIHEGDSVMYLKYGKNEAPQKKYITTGDDLIGKTYWIYKNSYGINHHFSFDGYYYLIFSTPSIQCSHAIIKDNIHSQQYNHEDVICEDRDGDGYYFWGYGDKPTHCPRCAPDEPDGDDSNPDLTVMNEYGQFLEGFARPNEIIITNTLWNVNDTLCGDVYIQNNATLSVHDASIILHPSSHIFVEEGATLIVDNSVIVNAEIIVNTGGNLIVRNKGIIQQGENDKVDIQLGGLVQIESGEIRIVE